MENRSAADLRLLPGCAGLEKSVSGKPPLVQAVVAVGSLIPVAPHWRDHISNRRRSIPSAYCDQPTHTRAMAGPIRAMHSSGGIALGIGQMDKGEVPLCQGCQGLHRAEQSQEVALNLGILTNRPFLLNSC